MASVLHANLSPVAIDGWQAVADDAGVSVTGLCEAVGQALAEHVRLGLPPDTDFGAQVRAITQNARKVDAHRRRRGSNR